MDENSEADVAKIEAQLKLMADGANISDLVAKPK